MFYIRVDGNTEIGAGHIMRCLAIAEALKDRGKVTIFITADEESSRLISGRGFGVLTLKTDPRDMEGELPVLLPNLLENNIKLLLVDSYSITEKYMKKIRERTKVVYLDDLGESLPETDVLINYNIYAQKLRYEENYRKRVLPVPELLLGCDYVPLRPEFQFAEAKVKKTVKDVLVTTGGGDMYHAALQIMEAVIRRGSVYRGIQFHVVSGAYNSSLEQLRALERDNGNIKVYHNVRHMSEIMKRCDVALAACGSTMYELSAMGVPAVCFYFVDNQKKIAEAFGENLAWNAGNLVEDEGAAVNRILEGLDYYMNSYEARCRACDDMMKLLDGDGASRIAEKLIRIKTAL